MSIIADRFTSTTEIPGFGIVPMRDLASARRALGVGETTCTAQGVCCVVKGTFTNPEGFTLSQCVEILEAVFGGTFGADAQVKNDGTFTVRSWAE
jgi:hypothetical protein